MNGGDGCLGEPPENLIDLLMPKRGAEPVEHDETRRGQPGPQTGQKLLVAERQQPVPILFAVQPAHAARE